MNVPHKQLPAFIEPLPLRIGIGLYILVQFLANGIFEDSKNTLVFGFGMFLFVTSLTLCSVGAFMVVIRNEKLNLQTPEAKMRRYYLYFVISLVAIILLLPIVAIYNNFIAAK